MDNLSYLFWAHVIFWILLFIYVLSLVEKNRKLGRELNALKNNPKGKNLS